MLYYDLVLGTDKTIVPIHVAHTSSCIAYMASGVNTHGIETTFVWAGTATSDLKQWTRIMIYLNIDVN